MSATSMERAEMTGVDPGGRVTCRPATSAAELAEHHAIRHAIFVVEQQVFADSDRDAYDDAPGVIHLLGRYAGKPAGTVRLFPIDADRGVWQGDRLCVLPPYRIRGVGAPLVRCAVAGAAARGGTRMVAHIQLPNVRFFTRLDWQVEGDTEIYAGLVHQPMGIDLPSPDIGARVERELFVGIQD